jgi:hypothetical protein
MEFKELLAKNWSRKAEIILIAIAGVCFVAELCEGISERALLTAIITMGALGLVGLAAQFAIDWKWGPRDKANGSPIDRRTLADPTEN